MGDAVGDAVDGVQDALDGNNANNSRTNTANTTSFQQMLDNARVHDRDGVLTDGEKQHLVKGKRDGSGHPVFFARGRKKSLLFGGEYVILAQLPPGNKMRQHSIHIRRSLRCVWMLIFLRF